MKRFERTTIASALLAGAALTFVPAMAQDLPKKSDSAEKSDVSAQHRQSDQQPVHKPDGGKMEGAIARGTAAGAGSSTDSEADTKADAKKSDDTSVSGKAEVSSAKDAAPGQTKTGDAKSAAEVSPGRRQIEGEVDSATKAAPGHTKTEAAGDMPSNEKTASVKITTEKKTEIRQVIHGTDVKPVHVDIDVSVGVAIPHKVELHPLPPRIVEIVPAYQGYDYFVMADGRIIIVEPSTYKVVYIITG